MNHPAPNARIHSLFQAGMTWIWWSKRRSEPSVEAKPCASLLGAGAGSVLALERPALGTNELLSRYVRLMLAGVEVLWGFLWCKAPCHVGIIAFGRPLW